MSSPRSASGSLYPGKDFSVEGFQGKGSSDKEGAPAKDDTAGGGYDPVIDWDAKTVTMPDGTVLKGAEFDAFFNDAGKGGKGGEGGGPIGPTFDTRSPLPDPAAMLQLSPHS